ncbi:hypothetical protein [Paenibacillus agricola]|uniref:Ribosomal protein L7/L12 C-terminal domain-containing protein n=1 Tax=Paenibacillus agricola TaxID=2716264 RepID=A0ABX0JLA7_9BACL|nr:hypothetical protein [Paenibacillus agricola]NHN34800.1 hypothetical protein [Paenibacillus agricola]
MSAMSDLFMMMWTIIIIFAMSVFFRIVFIRQKFTIDMLRIIVKGMELKNPIDIELQKLLAQGERKRAIKMAQKIYGFTPQEAEDHINSL